MYQEIIQRIKPELDKTIDYFTKELAKIRTGQASPSLVEDVSVDFSGQTMVLKQLAAISCPGRRLIVIQPWDATYIKPIEQALMKSQIGLNPAVDKNLIRIQLPPLTQEFRQTLEKLLGEKSEEIKQTIRRWREEAWSDIQTEARSGNIREDDKFKGKEELQKLIREYEGKIDELTERKRNEIQLN
ncbi:ribosome recycling factor [Patescibacteria group bacterium]|nr:ribosome recycling factor [Patescibacteria group bacterium]